MQFIWFQTCLYLSESIWLNKLKMTQIWVNGTRSPPDYYYCYLGHPVLLLQLQSYSLDHVEQVKWSKIDITNVHYFWQLWQTSYCSQDKRSGGRQGINCLITQKNIPYKDVFTNSLLRDQRYWRLLSYKEKIGTHLCYWGMGGIRTKHKLLYYTRHTFLDCYQGLLLLWEQFFEPLNLLQQRTLKSMIEVN